jgi:hypothetical protein
MKKYLVLFLFLLGSYSGGAWAANTEICRLGNGTNVYQIDLSLSTCFNFFSGYGYTGPSSSLACSSAFSLCGKFLNNLSIVSSCPNGVMNDGYTCITDIAPLCDSLICPADGGKSCKNSSGQNTTLLCPTTHFCLDGSQIPIGQTCTQTCPDGTTVDEGTSCPNKTCSDGSQVPNGQTCPDKQCPNGWTVPDGGTCPTETCPDGSIVSKGSCPAQTKTCPDGSTVAITATCPASVHCADGSYSSTGICPVPFFDYSRCPDGASRVDGKCSASGYHGYCGDVLFSFTTYPPFCDGYIAPTSAPTSAPTKTCSDGSTVAFTATCPTTKTCSDGSTVAFTATCPTGTGTGTGTTAGSYARGEYTVPAAFDNADKVTQAKTALTTKFNDIKVDAQILLVSLSAQNTYQCNPIYVSVINKNIDFCIDDYTSYFQQLGNILVFASYMFALFIILG